MTTLPPGHPFRFSTIAHADRAILGPMSAARLDALVERTPMARGDHLLEVGCGKGEFLVRMLARWPDATAEGFDLNPDFLADARAAAASAGGDVVQRLSLIATDAPGVLLDGRSVAVTAAMGATGAFGGDVDATCRALAAATRPGGLVILADGVWTAEPSADGLASFGMTRDELPDGVEGFAAIGVRAGLDVVDIEVVETDEWDAYEASYAGAVERWLAAHPDDPDHAAFRERMEGMRSSYAAWRRGTFGYAIGRFRVPD